METQQTLFEWDFFISHASEDKDEIARPVAQILTELGFKVWYDEFSLKLGDSLLGSINKGLTASQYGIVILSPNFFAKLWPQRELAGLLAQETTSGESKILFIWHKLTHKEVTNFYSLLADRKAVLSSDPNLIREIIRAVETSIKLPEHFPEPAHDILLPDEIIPAIRQIDEFKDCEISEEDSSTIYQVLWIYGIQTRQVLKDFIGARKILETLRTIYQEVLMRAIKPLDLAHTGAYLFSQNNTPGSIAYAKKLLRHTEEYRKTHPDEKITPIFTIEMSRISSGRNLSSMVEQADILNFDFDEPENEEEANLVSSFSNDIQDSINLGDVAVSVQTSFEFRRTIEDLEKKGLYIYGALRKSKIKLQNGEALDDLKMLYMKVTKRNVPKLIAIKNPYGQFP